MDFVDTDALKMGVIGERNFTHFHVVANSQWILNQNTFFVLLAFEYKVLHSILFLVEYFSSSCHILISFRGYI